MWNGGMEEREIGERKREKKEREDEKS